MKFFYILLLCIPTIYAMDNPKDDLGDREMTDQPTTGSSSNSKISRAPTVSSAASLPTVPGTASSSHDVLQPIYANEVSLDIEGRLDDFEKDFNKKMLMHKIDANLAEAFVDLMHNTKKMVASTTHFIVDSLISHPDFGLKTINEYFAIKRHEYSSTASSMFHPGSSPNRQLQETFVSNLNSFGSNLKADYAQQFNNTNKKIYICMGVGIGNLLLTAGTLTALYLK